MIDPFGYDHAGYIAAAYGLFAAATLYFVLATYGRLKVAERRIRAIARPHRTSSL